jgi:hypothetical protein
MAEEIRTEQDEYLDVFDSQIIGEMGALDSVGLDIPVNEALVNKIKARDSDPQFAVFELEPADSESNRRWNSGHIEKMATAINKQHPVAYKGHISEKDDAYAFPTIHAIWVGARTLVKKGKTVLQAKAYLKTPEIRDEVAMEMVTSISPRGDSRLRPLKGGMYDVVDFTMESLDFARKGRNGLPARLVALTTEMKDNDTSKGGLTVEPKEIAALSEEELRANNPLLVKAIEDKAKEPLTTKIGEMTTAVEAAEPEIDILKTVREKLGLKEDENPIESLATMLEEIEEAGKTKVKDFISEHLKGKVKSDKGQRLLKRMIGEQVSNIETEYADKDLDDKTKKEITEKLDEFIEDDEDIQAVIGEMTYERKPRSGEGGRSMGGRSSRSRESEGRQSRSGGVKFTSTKRTEL